MTKDQARRLTPGTRVVLGDEGKRAGMQGRAANEYGTIRAHTRWPHMSVRVRRDGQRAESSYHVDFWDVANKVEP